MNKRLIFGKGIRERINASAAASGNKKAMTGLPAMAFFLGRRLA
jgi:hypothetical protein